MADRRCHSDGDRHLVNALHRYARVPVADARLLPSPHPTISAALTSSGLPPSALELELTESVVMKNCERAAKRLTELRTLGISSAIDDFGTGYSSLKYLQNLPIDTLKIDQSFVRNLDPFSDGESGNGAIVRAIVNLAQQLGLRVVAEGVELMTS